MIAFVGVLLMFTGFALAIVALFPAAILNAFLYDLVILYCYKMQDLIGSRQTSWQVNHEKEPVKLVHQ